MQFGVMFKVRDVQMAERIHQSASSSLVDVPNRLVSLAQGAFVIIPEDYYEGLNSARPILDRIRVALMGYADVILLSECVRSLENGVFIPIYPDYVIELEIKLKGAIDLLRVKEIVQVHFRD